MNEDVIVLILGACEGAYALAASFGEYGIPVAVMDEKIPAAFSHSAFVGELWRVPGIGYRGILMRALNDFYAKHARAKLLLLSARASLAERVEAERTTIEQMYLLPKCNIGNAWEGKCPAALLLTYTDSAGTRHAYHARVCALDGCEPLAVIPMPQRDDLTAQAGEDGLALYGVTAEEEIFLLSQEGALSPMIAFPTALDASIVEWLLADLVFSVPAETKTDVLPAVFSRLPYKHLKPYALAEERERVARLREERLFLSLYPYRGEKKGPRARTILRRYLCAKWQKKTKTKK